MKVVISPDSYKGTLSAIEVASAMEAGILDVDPSIETVILPVADGGEGTLEALVTSTEGQYFSHRVLDPLGRKIEAKYGVLGDNETCVIEMAQASGIMLLRDEEKNPELASTYGTGQLIKAALDKGFRKFIVGIGGSATNDAGMGMLKALGLQLKKEDGTLIQDGVSALLDLASIDISQLDPRLAEAKFIIACDVDNPLIGEQGATAIFGPQKGVKEHQIAYFDSCLKQFADIVEKHVGIRLHDYKGAGAAGGMGGAIIAFLNGSFHAGIEIVMNAVQLKKHLEGAEFVMTGEGKSDHQTLHGKAPLGVAKTATLSNVNAVLLSGVIDENDKPTLLEHFTVVESLVDETISVSQAMQEPYYFIRRKTKKMVEHYIQNGYNFDPL
ncbi:glycerate kinase [Lysinibacillus sphaericus]|uniref:glycerate kinase n=1 Tax=Lysinibacillus sphaericus TaxID=1421 RepID=UPI0018CF3C42|nr:glycerate kinase [Lysinibacillus sphaericus]MBG9456691.1 glycerate kinase [Lysinibacillus sphaericus]MBG9476854.1 glycerate kinase [Lysinibacillus sphaericus]MBG9591403.1 glycerate kinase [Lysinibacillus sphaericus]